MAQSLWVFDLDDTLVASCVYYNRTALSAASLISDALDHRTPRYSEIVALIDSNHQERLGEGRLSRDDFSSGLVECYRRLCAQVRVKSDPTVEKRCRNIVYSVLSEEAYQGRQLVPGAEETLLFLLAQGNPLFCVTSGESQLQWIKWRGYNLRRFFPTAKEFRVVKRKKLEVLRGLRKSYPDLRAFMVGDSVSKDLVQAFQAGMTPVYIPPPAVWDKSLELPPQTVLLTNISEIKERRNEFVSLPTS